MPQDMLAVFLFLMVIGVVAIYAYMKFFSIDGVTNTEIFKGNDFYIYFGLYLGVLITFFIALLAFPFYSDLLEWLLDNILR